MRKRIKKPSAKKKAKPPAVVAEQAAFPNTIDQADLAKLCNLTTRRLNQLAAGGKIPHVVSRGVYPWAAINALFAYYQRDGEDIQREKLLKLTAERKMKEDDLARGRGLLIEISEARRQIGVAIGFMFEERQRWTRELPPSLAGLSAVEIDKIMEAQNRAGWKVLEEKFSKIGK